MEERTPSSIIDETKFSPVSQQEVNMLIFNINSNEGYLSIRKFLEMNETWNQSDKKELGENSILILKQMPHRVKNLWG